jgi:hypothetical protein
VVPRLPRSVGFGPVRSPPCLARTLQLSTTMSRARAAASGPDRVMRSGRFRAGPGHAEQNGMDPRQQRHIAPFPQPPAQRRAGGAAGTGEQLAPLDTFTQKELQRRNDFRCRKARSPGFFRFPFQLFDDTGDQIDGCYSQRSLDDYVHRHICIYGNGRFEFVCAKGRQLHGIEADDFWKPRLSWHGGRIPG